MLSMFQSTDLPELMAAVLYILKSSLKQSKTGTLPGLLFEILLSMHTGDLERSLIRFRMDRKPSFILGPTLQAPLISVDFGSSTSEPAKALARGVRRAVEDR